jgi:hypothetical protein
MLNYTETMSISPTVPVTQPLQDQCQERAPDPLMLVLSALIAHPEFQQGVRDCLIYYGDLYDETPLTDEEMIWEVETSLSRRASMADLHSVAMTGSTCPSYLEKLGWVVGTIAKGLTYMDGHVE